MLYPNLEAALLGSGSRWNAYDDLARGSAAYWSKNLACEVSVLAASSIFVLLEQNERRWCKLLTTDGQFGWIKPSEDMRYFVEVTE